MHPLGERDTLTVLVVDAPPDFEQRVRAALPEANVAHTDRRRALLRGGPNTLVVLYERNSDDRVLTEFAHLVPTVVVSERPDPARAGISLESGADGYLDAGIAVAGLRSALLGVSRGELAYGREMFGAWLRSRQSRPKATTTELTPRQEQIIDLIAHGASDKEIAARIGVRTATAQKHVARLLRRLGVRNRAAAVAAQRTPAHPRRITG
jgi:DNA-binding NarL/FixJ family response regulator